MIYLVFTISTVYLVKYVAVVPEKKQKIKYLKRNALFISGVRIVLYQA